MNTKVTFLLLLVLLIILMLFYYIDLESNIIILLGVVIVLIIHNLITKKEHFNINEQAARLEAQIDSLTAVAEALRVRNRETPTEREPLTITRSCPFNPTTTQRQGIIPAQQVPNSVVEGVNLGPAFGNSLTQLNAGDLRNMFNSNNQDNSEGGSSNEESSGDGSGDGSTGGTE